MAERMHQPGRLRHLLVPGSYWLTGILIIFF